MCTRNQANINNSLCTCGAGVFYLSQPFSPPLTWPLLSFSSDFCAFGVGGVSCGGRRSKQTAPAKEKFLHWVGRWLAEVTTGQRPI